MDLWEIKFYFYVIIFGLFYYGYFVNIFIIWGLYDFFIVIEVYFKDLDIGEVLILL